MSKPQAVRGTQSMIGEAAERFHAVIAAFDKVRRLYGFGRVEVPMFEATPVFARTLGESTDVVSKEMYTFEDRGGDSITLRPELTAGIARAYISEGWQQHAPLKVATWGAAFRYERPQKGRFRQFHQLDAEIIGAAEPAADVELIAMAQHVLAELKLADRCQLNLNTLGDPATREAWRKALVEHFASHRDVLSEESRARLDRNPLRILDSKSPQDKPIAAAAPVIDEFLTTEASEFFEKVTAGLDAAGVAWTREPRLVRGLDYYRHTAFEFVTDDLGAQNQVIGGGRYDGLIEAMGGPPTPAVGWASGIERMALMFDADQPDRFDFGVFSEVQQFDLIAVQVAKRLRTQGFKCNLNVYGSPRKRYSKLSSDENQFLIRVTNDSSSDQPLIKVRTQAKYPYKRIDERAVAQALTGLAPLEIEMSVRETWEEMKARRATETTGAAFH